MCLITNSIPSKPSLNRSLSQAAVINLSALHSCSVPKYTATSQPVTLLTPASYLVCPF